MSDTTGKPDKPQRKPRRQSQPAHDPARAARFTWGEHDLVITKAKFSRSYDPGDGGRVLVQDLAELVLHLQQTRPDLDLQEALEEFLQAPDAAHMPATLRRELRDAGLLRETEGRP